MVKMRSAKSANKRLKLLANKKVKRKHAYTSHLASHKSTKQKRHLRKSTFLHKSDIKRLEKIL